MINRISRFKAALSAAALGIGLSACATVEAEPVAVASAAPAPVTGAASGPALWKVSDEDTTIYMFGTVHVLPGDMDWFRGPVSAALAGSDTIVTELLPGAVTDPANQQVVMGMAMLPEGQSLRDMLDNEQRADYEAALTSLGLPVGALDRFEPWMAGITLTTLPLMKAGYKLDQGAEQVVEARAPSGAKRDALETFRSQMDLFDTLAIDSQIDFLMTTARSIDEVVPMIDSMVGEWETGDADDLARLMNSSLTDADLAERLLYARNRAWAQWIGKRLDTPGTVFVAVGAGHLAGAKSVQDFLAQSGLTVVRVQ